MAEGVEIGRLRIKREHLLRQGSVFRVALTRRTKGTGFRNKGEGCLLLDVMQQLAPSVIEREYAAVQGASLIKGIYLCSGQVQ